MAGCVRAGNGRRCVLYTAASLLLASDRNDEARKSLTQRRHRLFHGSPLPFLSCGPTTCCFSSFRMDPHKDSHESFYMCRKATESLFVRVRQVFDNDLASVVGCSLFDSQIDLFVHRRLNTQLLCLSKYKPVEAINFSSSV